MSLPYQPHSATSFAAAMQAEAAADTMRGRVLRALIDAGPARRLPDGFVVGGRTDEELQQQLRMNPNTERPRRIELERKGYVRDSGKTRPTSASTFAAVVWEAVDPEAGPGTSKKPGRKARSAQLGLFDSGPAVS